MRLRSTTHEGARPPFTRQARFALVGAGCAAAPAPAARSPEAAVNELLAADRAFSEVSARTDLVSGLTPMFADDVVMPVPGRGFAEGAVAVVEALRSNPENAQSRLE